MSRLLARTVCVLAATLVTHLLLYYIESARAADISGSRLGIGIKGRIEVGDEAKFLQVLAELRQSRHERITAVELNSEGGDFVESAKLARDIGDNHLIAVVNWDAICYSACFNLFAAGGPAWVSSLSRVGVHNMADKAGNASDSLTMWLARVYRQLGVPSSIIGKMVSTPPNQITLLDEEDFKQLGADYHADMTALEVADALISVREDKQLKEEMQHPSPDDCAAVIGGGPPPPGPKSGERWCTQADYDRFNTPEWQAAAEKRDAAREQMVQRLASEMPPLGSAAFWAWVARYKEDNQ